MSNSQHPVVSYILTTKNRAPFLDRTLNNVREFITSDDELIIYDACSTDNTRDVVEKYSDIVTLFCSEPDFGEAHGFNKAILSSRGKYIKLLTDDDYFYPNAMRAAISILDSNPDIDALMTGGEAFYHDYNTNVNILVSYLRLPTDCCLKDDILNLYIYCQCGIGLIFHRRLISIVGLLDTTFHAVDREFLSRLFSHNIVFKYYDIKLFRHIAHDDSGQNNAYLCHRDSIRSLFRYGAWETIFKRKAYTLSAIADAIGISDLPGSWYVVYILDYIESLRRSIVGRILLLPLFIWAYLLFHLNYTISFLSGKIKSACKVIILHDDTHSHSLDEPPWDGGLR